MPSSEKGHVTYAMFGKQWMDGFCECRVEMVCEEGCVVAGKGRREAGEV